MDVINEKETNLKLTVEEVFAKMAELQGQLTENSYNSMHRLTDSVESICGSSMGEEEMRESLNDVTTVFLSRETSYREMIAFYREILDRISVKPEKKIEMIRSAFESQTALIGDSDMVSEEMFAALSDITEKIFGLVEKVLADLS